MIKEPISDIKEHPFLFATPEVLAVRSGLKTQVREVITYRSTETVGRCGECHRPIEGIKRMPLPNTEPPPYLDPDMVKPMDWKGRTTFIWLAPEKMWTIGCPYGRPGDRLWMRETIWSLHDSDTIEGQSLDCGPILDMGPGCCRIDYVATPRVLSLPKLEHSQTINVPENVNVPGDWWLAPPDNWNGHDEKDHLQRGQWEFMPWDKYTKHPSVHMPRWASRTLLEIVDIRTERVQDISEKDAIAEGVEVLFTHNEIHQQPRYKSELDLDPMPYKNYLWHGHFGGYGTGNKQSDDWVYQYSSYKTAVDSFSSWWHRYHSKRGFGWSINPWVWVIEFKVVQTEVGHA